MNKPSFRWNFLVICILELCNGKEGTETVPDHRKDEIRPHGYAQLYSNDYESFSGIFPNEPSTTTTTITSTSKSKIEIERYLRYGYLIYIDRFI